MKRKISTEDFVTKAKLIHGDLYDYAESVYISAKTKSKIKCKQHGVFLQSPDNHLSGKGCPMCKGQKISKSKTHTNFIERAINLNGDRYDYSLVQYTKIIEPVKIICKQHGEFTQVARQHLKGIHCPKCKISSKGEYHIKEFLDFNNIEYISQKSFKECINPITKYKLRFDIYVPSYNLLIEYDGIQHFKFVGEFQNNEEGLEYQKYKDLIKNEFARKSKINLLRISYEENNGFDIGRIIDQKFFDIMNKNVWNLHEQ